MFNYTKFIWAFSNLYKLLSYNQKAKESERKKKCFSFVMFDTRSAAIIIDEKEQFNTSRLFVVVEALNLISRSYIINATRC